MAFRSSRARGRIRTSGIGAAHAGLLARLRQHIGHDERHGLAAALAVDERLAKASRLSSRALPEAHRGADNLALGFEAAGLDLLRDEALEMLAQSDAGVPRHGKTPCGVY